MFSLLKLIPCIFINLFWVIILYYTFINSRFDQGIIENITIADVDKDDKIKLDPVNLSNIEDNSTGRIILFFIFTLISCIFGAPAFYFLATSFKKAVDRKNKIFNICAYTFIIFSIIILMATNFDIFSILLIILFELSFLGIILYFKTDFLDPCIIFLKKLSKCCGCRRNTIQQLGSY